VTDLPGVLVERIEHYFATYKLVPGQEANIRVQEVYGLTHAKRVIVAAIGDYQRMGEA
jgi:inorganic pyrophosphatase